MISGIASLARLARAIPKISKGTKGSTLYRGTTGSPKAELMWSKPQAGMKFTPLKEAAIRAAAQSSEKASKLFPDEYNPAVLKKITNVDRSKYLQPHENISVIREGNEIPINLAASLSNYRKLGIPNRELLKYLLYIMGKDYKLFNRGGIVSLVL